MDINTKPFCNMLEEESFEWFWGLYAFIEYFIKHFVNIALTFFNGSFNSFSTTTCSFYLE